MGRGWLLCTCHNTAGRAGCAVHANTAPQRGPHDVTTEERLRRFADRKLTTADYGMAGWDLAGDVAVVLARLSSARAAYRNATGRELD